MKRLLIIATLSCAALAQTPREQAFMLPALVHVRGIVTDSSGHPLSEVRIDHTGIRQAWPKTDAEGHFDIETRAPAIVFRKAGFESQYWQVSSNANVTFVLASSALHLKECRTFSGCLSLKSSHGEFCFPKVPGVLAGKRAADIDYVARSFWIKTATGTTRIIHGAGPMWGSGVPNNVDVWTAVEYSEKSYATNDGFQIIDARGKRSDGTRWRLLGHVFETAFYSSVPEKDAAALDRVLDGVCLK